MPVKNYDAFSSDEGTLTPRAKSPSLPLPPTDNQPVNTTFFSIPGDITSIPSNRTSYQSAFRHAHSPSPSDSEGGYHSMLLRPDKPTWWQDTWTWWTMSHSSYRRGESSRVYTLRRKFRRTGRHPFVPRQPITILLTIILFSTFAILLTLFLAYYLNPDKAPLPWRAYCSVPPTYFTVDQLPGLSSDPNSFFYHNQTRQDHVVFPPNDLDTMAPAGMFLGVFTIDSSAERRMLVRNTWAHHQRSRNGAGKGDNGIGTSRTIVRFILGQPKKEWERRVQLEMTMYNDIVILPITENMNDGKIHAYFSWAAVHAWVPPIYNLSLLYPPLSYSYHTTPPPPLAPHDSLQAHQNIVMDNPKPWVRPDFVVKVDDDAFVMLAELESRLRIELNKLPDSLSTSPPVLASREAFQSATPPVARKEIDPLIYWGYLITNHLHQFMAGELYALSWSLVEWVSQDPAVKAMTRGAEDKQTSKWMRIHPRASEIRWVSERCWLYDHPRSGTVYSHGFLFPSEVSRIKSVVKPQLDEYLPASSVLGELQSYTPNPTSWAHSSVSTFNVRYTPPLSEMSMQHSIEALIEGSTMSTLREGHPTTSEYAWEHREGHIQRYEGQRVGGTIVVHYIKKHTWFLETAIAFLGSDEYLPFEQR